MKQHRLLISACVLTVLISFIMIFRSFSARASFERSVNEKLKTSEGYDQRFIDMVNRLEELLATRAQFGYSGGKDPMTGVTRQVVQAPKPAAKPKFRPAPKQTAAAETQAAPPRPEPPADEVRLTAIIADATGMKISAIIMDGERSYSVDVGDKVVGRKITRITNEGIYMESETMLYFYDIYGNAVRKSKQTGALTPALKEEPSAPAEQKKTEVQKKTAPLRPLPIQKKRR
ncbi:MAG: hypothetical protein JXA71_04435 [Chitinispirillaceae bacterium]|nr:hypothetical protein [Chitinispirillaceae bacterium]